MSLNIIGISAFYHDAACCLLQDGILKAAAEEERFSRIKADPSIPVQAFKYCLEEAGLKISDIDCIAYYEQPGKKLERQLWSGVLGNAPALPNFHVNDVEAQMRQVLGYEGKIVYQDHHLSHAASSFFFSGFEKAAILTVDGVGEWATTSYGYGAAGAIEIFEEVEFPDSLGLLYSTITSFVGFDVNDGEYKVMGLAPYGIPRYADKIRMLIKDGPRGQYRLDMKYFDFLDGQSMYSDQLAQLLEIPPRAKGSEVKQVHKDIARSLQVVLEETLLNKSRYLYERTGLDNLCMAGGVALNCVANGQILKKGPFRELFVQPAANDAGGSIGAAALAHIQLSNEGITRKRMAHAYWGPFYSSEKVNKLLQSTSLFFHDYRGREKELCTRVAGELAAGKVTGWFQGRMEFGPRALGARSILADPRDAGMRDKINAMVKKREGFRPFAPAVLDFKASEHFDLDHPSPFMLETCRTISRLDLPAITHVDGSARVQTVSRNTNPRFYHLLMEFDRLVDCPLLLNTSFNVKGEPIVCTPEDALKCFITADIDCLVIEDFMILREENDLELLKIIILGENAFNHEAEHGTISHDLYTFI